MEVGEREREEVTNRVILMMDVIYIYTHFHFHVY